MKKEFEKVAFPIKYLTPRINIYPPIILPFHIISTSTKLSKHWNYYNCDKRDDDIFYSGSNNQKKKFAIMLLQSLDRNFNIINDVVYDYGSKKENAVIPYKFINNALVYENDISYKCNFIFDTNINFKKYDVDANNNSFEDVMNFHINRIKTMSLSFVKELLYIKNE